MILAASGKRCCHTLLLLTPPVTYWESGSPHQAGPGSRDSLHLYIGAAQRLRREDSLTVNGLSGGFSLLSRLAPEGSQLRLNPFPSSCPEAPCLLPFLSSLCFSCFTHFLWRFFSLMAFSLRPPKPLQRNVVQSSGAHMTKCHHWSMHTRPVLPAKCDTPLWRTSCQK